MINEYHMFREPKHIKLVQSPIKPSLYLCDMRSITRQKGVNKLQVELGWHTPGKTRINIWEQELKLFEKELPSPRRTLWGGLGKPSDIDTVSLETEKVLTIEFKGKRPRGGWEQCLSVVCQGYTTKVGEA